MSVPLLTTRRLSVSHGRRRVVHELDLELTSGITALLGPNGAGKTTLLTSLARQGRGDLGSVTLADDLLRGEAARRADDALIGFMPQHWTFFPAFTAMESVQYAAWLKGLSAAEARVAAMAALDEVGLLGEAKIRVRRLSGGMRQRVGLAEAMVGETPVVLLDEPTVGLDPQQRAQFRNLLKRKADSAAVVLSTHLTEDVSAIADRVIVFGSGRVLFDGSPAQLTDLALASGEQTSALEAGYLTALEMDGARA